MRVVTYFSLQKPRRSSRIRETADVTVFSSDDERRKSPKAKRRSRSQSRKSKKLTESVTKVGVSVTEKQPETKGYTLRSSSFQMDLSEEEATPDRVRVSSKKPIKSVPLSEGKFKRQITGMRRKALISSTPNISISSTPYTSTARKPQTRLSFDNSNNTQLVKSVEKATTVRKRGEQPKSFSGMEMESDLEFEIAEADDESDDVPPSQFRVHKEIIESISVSPNTKHGASSMPNRAWLSAVGWKEFTLATFLTGIGVISYLCLTTDYCHYC